MKSAMRSTSRTLSNAQDSLTRQTGHVQFRAQQQIEQAQQRAAKEASRAYVKKATGGLVNNVPPGVSNAALGYAKKNPKDAMKAANFLSKALK